MSEDQRFMQMALELADYAGNNDEVPVGAVICYQGEVIGKGANSVIRDNDPTAHAEIKALRQASQKVSNYRLVDTVMYCTLEPCPMCAGAIVHARVKKVFIATQEPRAGAAGSVMNILQNPNLNHCCDLEFGLMKEHSSQILKQFFKQRRK